MFTTFNFASQIDTFLDSSPIFNSKVKDVTFHYIQISNFGEFEFRDTSACNLVFNNDGLYKLKIDQKLLSFNGHKVKSYDFLTNQLFIQNKNNRINIKNFFNKDLLKKMQLQIAEDGYLIKVEDIGDFLVIVDSLKLINRIESINATNKLIIENFQINFLDSIDNTVFNIDVPEAIIFDMSNE